MERIELTIYGEPASKANSRQLVTISGKPRFIKSAKARNYMRDVMLQVPARASLMNGPLRLTAHVYYATQRPDLDISVLLDALQGRIYENDRQVREQHLFHHIDRDQPRAEVVIEPLEGEPK